MSGIGSDWTPPETEVKRDKEIDEKLSKLLGVKWPDVLKQPYRAPTIHDTEPVRRVSLITKLALLWAKRPRFSAHTRERMWINTKIAAVFIGILFGIFLLCLGVSYLDEGAKKERALKQCIEFANEKPAEVPMRCQIGWKP